MLNLCILLIIGLWWQAVGTAALAQTSLLEVRVSAAMGAVSVISRTRGSAATVPLKRGQFLYPGDIIETGAGRAVLALGDGSMVIVYSQSRVVLKDFRSAG